MNTQQTALGLNLRRARKAKGLTQGELAGLSGVTGVSGIESGRTAEPKMSTVVKLAESLDVEVGDLTQEPARCGECGRYTDNDPAASGPEVVA